MTKFNSVFRKIGLAALAATALTASHSSFAQTPQSQFTEDQKKEIKTLVFQAVQDNPMAFVQTISKAIQEQRTKPITDQALLAEIKTPVNHITTGPKTAPIVAIFTDPECSACRQYAPIMKKLGDEQKVQIVVINVPIVHKESVEPALKEQAYLRAYPEKGWALFEAMENYNGETTGPIVDQLAQKLGMKLTEVNDEDKAQIAKNVMLAQKTQIQGTPSIIIGNKKNEGGLTLEQVYQQAGVH